MDEVLEMMRFKIEMQKIRINYNASFKKPDAVKTDFVNMIQYERMKENLLSIDR